MWYACSVAVNSWFEEPLVNAPYNLAAGIRIEPIPDWIKNEKALELLSWTDRKNIQNAELAFAVEYEADALGSADPDWSGLEPRSIQSSIDERFALASVALWLAKPSRLTCGPLLHFGKKGDSNSLRTAGSLKPVLIREDEYDNVPTADDLAYAGRLLETIVTLRRDATTWIAIRMLVRALTEFMWEARYLWQWVVMEALFGPDNPAETTYRVANRIAMFLGESSAERKKLFTLAKEAYAWRSKIVHGRMLLKLTPEKSLELSACTEQMIRDALQKLLGSTDLVKSFDTRGRDKFLDELVFR